MNDTFKEKLKPTDVRRIREDYNADQPRDADGKWGSGGGGSGSRDTGYAEGVAAAHDINAYNARQAAAAQDRLRQNMQGVGVSRDASGRVSLSFGGPKSGDTLKQGEAQLGTRLDHQDAGPGTVVSTSSYISVDGSTRDNISFQPDAATGSETRGGYASGPVSADQGEFRHI